MLATLPTEGQLLDVLLRQPPPGDQGAPFVRNLEGSSPGSSELDQTVAFIAMLEDPGTGGGDGGGGREGGEGGWGGLVGGGDGGLGIEEHWTVAANMTFPPQVSHQALAQPMPVHVRSRLHVLFPMHRFRT